MSTGGIPQTALLFFFFLVVVVCRHQLPSNSVPAIVAAITSARDVCVYCLSECEECGFSDETDIVLGLGLQGKQLNGSRGAQDGKAMKCRGSEKRCLLSSFNPLRARGQKKYLAACGAAEKLCLHPCQLRLKAHEMVHSQLTYSHSPQHISLLTIMIEIVCNDRLGKKVRVKCKYVILSSPWSRPIHCIDGSTTAVQWKSTNHSASEQKADRISETDAICAHSPGLPGAAADLLDLQVHQKPQHASDLTYIVPISFSFHFVVAMTLSATSRS